MEPAKIDWKNIDSKFIKDELYENINAPKWFDFSVPEEIVDDEAWFCKAECKHPKTAEDFVKSTFTSKVKQLRLPSVSENLPLRDRNLRDANAKTEGFASSSNIRKLNKSKTVKPPDKFQEDQENENPNFSTPLNYQSKNMKLGIEKKKKPFDKSPLDSSQEEQKQQLKLKSTLSASNLFAGKEILSHITEFCSELKKLVMKTKEGEISKKSNGKNNQKEKFSEGFVSEVSDDLMEIERENELLLELEKGKFEVVDTSSNKEKQRILNNAKMENIRSPLVLKVAGRGQEESLLQVRTCPPSPQCFSTDREPLRRAKTTAPLKPSKSIRTEKGVLQEVEQSKEMEQSSEVEKESTDKANTKNISIAGKEARTMEMFWLLKPCLAK